MNTNTDFDKIDKVLSKNIGQGDEKLCTTVCSLA